MTSSLRTQDNAAGLTNDILLRTRENAAALLKVTASSTKTFVVVGTSGNSCIGCSVQKIGTSFRSELVFMGVMVTPLTTNN
jgi:hypothetical protein